jgi:hypothetical protein
MTNQPLASAELDSRVSDDQRGAVARQLKRIQDSHAFCNSARAKEFLSYVVENALEGRTEQLKERSIGVNLFHRTPTYITGEDPIVRVKAAEVRKRLAQYYSEEDSTAEVRIEIPVGSYVPKFHWKAVVPPDNPPVPEIPQVKQEAVQAKEEAVSAEPVRGKFGRVQIALFASLLVFLGLACSIAIRRQSHEKSAFDEFWAPVFNTGQSALICLAAPVTYAVNSKLYALAASAHPGMYDTQVKRDSTPLELDPETPLRWKDLTPLPDYSVNKDDAYVAAELTDLFARIHKTSQVRIGRDFTYEDLRNSPAVLIGAFDNPWTMRVGSELPILFREPEGIVERGGQGRVWHMEGDKRGTRDFALIARLRNSKTGQFLVIVAGIGMVGTQAAGRFVSHPGDLDAALRAAPKDWREKNVEIVLESDVIDDSASPPRVVALETW